MLDRNGFKRKNFADLQAEMETKAKELFGENVNLTLKSPLGILIWLFAWFLSKVWELAEKVYNSAFVTKAEGVQLDYLTPFYHTSREPEQYAFVTLAFTGTPHYTILEGNRYETKSGIDFALTENVELDSQGNGSGKAICLTPGVIGNVEANTITVQSEPSADVFTVTNPEKAEGGREEETDDELKKRLFNSGAGGGSATPNAILAAVLGVPGVRAANIAVNNTNEPANGLPPKSFQVYTLGGDSQAIAEAIFSKGAGGIEPFGTTSVTVEDIAGNTHTVKYTPATAIDIFSNVNVTTDSTFQANGITQIKDAIIALIGGTASDGTTYTGLNMGEDVIYSRVLTAVMGVQGVTDATVTIGTTVETQGTANIVINANEVAQIDSDKISVVVS